jgi:hypothetical protein
VLIAPSQAAKIISNVVLENIAVKGTEMQFAVKVARVNCVTQMKIVAVQENVALRINARHLDVPVTLILIANLVSTVASRTQGARVTLVVSGKSVSGTKIVEPQERNVHIQIAIVISGITGKNALNYENINVLTKTVVIHMTTAMYLEAVITAVETNILCLAETATQIVLRSIVTKTVIVVVPVNAVTQTMNASNVQIMFPRGSLELLSEFRWSLS